MENITSQLGNSGKIACNRNILLSIISLATKEISGVASMSKEKKSFFIRLFDKKEADGVKIHFNPNNVLVIDVYINIYNGYSVPEVAYRIQENVKNNIRSMVDMHTSKVNVHIMNVEFPKEEI